MEEDDQEKDYYSGKEVGEELEAAALAVSLSLLVLLLMHLGLAIGGLIVRRTPLSWNLDYSCYSH